MRGETDERELTIEDLVMTGGKGKGKAIDEDDIELEQDELADDEDEEEAQSKVRSLSPDFCPFSVLLSFYQSFD